MPLSSSGDPASARAAHASVLSAHLARRNVQPIEVKSLDRLVKAEKERKKESEKDREQAESKTKGELARLAREKKEREERAARMEKKRTEKVTEREVGEAKRRDEVYMYIFQKPNN